MYAGTALLLANIDTTYVVALDLLRQMDSSEHSSLSTSPVPVSLKLLKRIAEFSQELVPLEEALEFYSLDTAKPPPHRPWVWFNCVSSFDGVITFVHQFICIYPSY